MHYTEGGDTILVVEFLNCWRGELEFIGEEVVRRAPDGGTIHFLMSCFSVALRAAAKQEFTGRRIELIDQ
jgi:hypothetical protein